VVYTLVTYQPGPPAIKPNSPPFRTLVDCNCLLEGTPAVEIIDDLAPRPGEPLTNVAFESTARAAGDLQYRTIVVSDGCLADTDEGHANSLAAFKKWFGETPTAAEVLTALNRRGRRP
jgi:biuret amidohydrolase